MFQLVVVMSDYLSAARESCIRCFVIFFFQAEDGIRDLVRSRGLGDVYKRQLPYRNIDNLSLSA